MHTLTGSVPCLNPHVASPHPEDQAPFPGLMGKSLPSAGLGAGLLGNSWIGHWGASCTHRLFRGLCCKRCFGLSVPQIRVRGHSSLPEPGTLRNCILCSYLGMFWGKDFQMGVDPLQEGTSLK